MNGTEGVPFYHAEDFVWWEFLWMEGPSAIIISRMRTSKNHQLSKKWSLMCPKAWVSTKKMKNKNRAEKSKNQIEKNRNRQKSEKTIIELI